MNIPAPGEPAAVCGLWQMQFHSSPSRWELTIQKRFDKDNCTETYRKCVAVFYDKEFCDVAWSWIVYHAS